MSNTFTFQAFDRSCLTVDNMVDADVLKTEKMYQNTVNYCYFSVF